MLLGALRRRPVCRCARFSAIAAAGQSASSGRHTLLVDGAARGNPGHGGCGCVVMDAGNKVVDTRAVYLGSKITCNTAEYYGLIEGLSMASELGLRHLDVLLDSQLVTMQMTGKYKVQARHLVPLHKRATSVAGGFESISFAHIPRAQNKAADALANQAIDDWEAGLTGADAPPPQAAKRRKRRALSAQTVVQLKELCAQAGLTKTGRKQDLIDRLEQHAEEAHEEAAAGTGLQSATGTD
jgi:ribonuclease HI